MQLNKDKVLSGLIEAYIRAIFDDRKVPKKMRDSLWLYYYDKLSKGIDSGYSSKLGSYNKELARSLKKNIAQFSAFKETSFSKQLEQALTKKGKIVPWNEFKKEALEVSGLYNVNWLQTEYHTTVATANMAGKWEDFQANKDLYPNLRYDAINDDRTRKTHRDWDGLVAPMDHPIWKKIYPPNDYGCRCNVTQTDDDVSTDLPTPEVKAAFNNNAAISGKVFNDVVYDKDFSETQRKEVLKYAETQFKANEKRK